MNKHRLRYQIIFLGMATCILISGCGAPKSLNIIFDRQPYEQIINADQLTIDVISINNALISEEVIEEAVDLYRPYVSGVIRLNDCNHVGLDLGDDNSVSKKQFYDLIFSRKDFGPTQITIVVCPDTDFFSKKGLYTGMWPEGKPEKIRHFVLINANVCTKSASSIPFVSTKKFTSLVLLHELCHGLRVPGRKGYMKKGNERHCSDPNCILYPRVDLASAVNAILHFGPPESLCKKCKEEVLAVQKKNIFN